MASNTVAYISMAIAIVAVIVGGLALWFSRRNPSTVIGIDGPTGPTGPIGVPGPIGPRGETTFVQGGSGIPISTQLSEPLLNWLRLAYNHIAFEDIEQVEGGGTRARIVFRPRRPNGVAIVNSVADGNDAVAFFDRQNQQTATILGGVANNTSFTYWSLLGDDGTMQTNYFAAGPGNRVIP